MPTKDMTQEFKKTSFNKQQRENKRLGRKAKGLRKIGICTYGLFSFSQNARKQETLTYSYKHRQIKLHAVRLCVR